MFTFLQLFFLLLEEQNQESNHGATVAIVLSVLFLAITTIVLIAIYYRRRLKRMKTDLQNRSVYYVENSILGRYFKNNSDEFGFNRFRFFGTL